MNFPAGIWTPIRGTPDDISWSGPHQKLDRAPSSTVLDLDITGVHTRGVLSCCHSRAPHRPLGLGCVVWSSGQSPGQPGIRQLPHTFIQLRSSSWLDHPGVQGTAGGLVAPHLSGVVLGVPPPRQVQDGGMRTCREVEMRSVPPCRTEHRTT